MFTSEASNFDFGLRSKPAVIRAVPLKGSGLVQYEYWNRNLSIDNNTDSSGCHMMMSQAGIASPGHCSGARGRGPFHDKHNQEAGSLELSLSSPSCRKMVISVIYRVETNTPMNGGSQDVRFKKLKESKAP